MEVQPATIMVILSGILTGLVFGFVLQRGRYWMNSAFRDVIFVNDITLLRAWLLALAVAIVGSNGLEALGFLGDDGLTRQTFAPIAAIVGGYIFGLGIVMAGGCGSGVLYKQGEGTFAAFVAMLGFGLSLIASYHGPLQPLMQFLKSYKVSIGTGDDAIANPALWDILGGPDYKWIIIAVVVGIMLPVIIKGRPFGKQPKKGWSWSLGGLLVGLVIIGAWWTSYQWGGRARGLSFSGPLAESMFFFLTGDSGARNDQLFSILGYGSISWSSLYILGVPLGAYISAKGLGEFKLTTPREAAELLRVFFGGVVMGIGGALAGGWTVGHALTGVSGLALQSIVATVFIILGNWTMVYFMFIKPMQD